ncbi:MAG: flagellar filament capping protein FliD [Gammaproteobacteria bacterium]|nr:flagellar filament capping protein FliD [Gammaproteobacteria bacterium]
MASIVSTGIGSGLDIAGIVQQLVAAEGQPVDARINQQEARAQAKLSAFGSLKSALSDLRDKLDIMKDLDRFLTRRALSSNEDVFAVSAGTDALPASYSMEVVQLAQAQKLTSGAFADADAVVGTGTLTIGVGTSTLDIEITAENNTLSGIRDAINADSGNPGIAATIVNADSGSYLILTADATGAANTITVTQAGGDGGLSALEYDPGAGLTALTESIAPQDALIRIDGLDVMNDTNTFDGVVQGVSITALSETSGAETLLVENDDQAARQLVADFVESYNAMVDTFDGLTAFNAEAETAAPLIGDATIRQIRDQIRRELSTAVKDIDAPFSMLGDVGIEVQLDGRLQIDDDKLGGILADDFVKFGQLFAASDGFAVRVHALADGYLETDGVLDTRTKGLTSTIEGLTDDRDALNERLALLETRLLRQFNALDSLLAQLSSTSNFLTQQLANLPGASQSGGST